MISKEDIEQSNAIFDLVRATLLSEQERGHRIRGIPAVIGLITIAHSSLVVSDVTKDTDAIKNIRAWEIILRMVVHLSATVGDQKAS